MSKSVKILVADDAPSIRQLVSEFLNAEFGVLPELVEDGLDAYVIASSQPLDLIITDLQMPYLDGWQLIQAVRHKSGPNQSLPIILFSGFLDAIDDSNKSIDDVHFVPKPLKAESFLRVCQTLLAAHLVA